MLQIRRQIHWEQIESHFCLILTITHHPNCPKVSIVLEIKQQRSNYFSIASPAKTDGAEING